MVLLQFSVFPCNIFPAKPPLDKSNTNTNLQLQTKPSARNAGLECETEPNSKLSLSRSHHFSPLPKAAVTNNYISLSNRVNVHTSSIIHAQVVKSGLQSNTWIGSKLVISYSRDLKSLDDARRLFDEIPVRTTQAYVVLIRSYSRSYRWRDVVALAVLMIHQGLKLDKYLAPTLLKACSALQLLGFGRMVHACVVRGGGGLEMDVFVGNALIDMYANCGDLDSSRTSFQLMQQRDVVSFTALVSAYMDAGEMAAAKQLFDTMEVSGVKPDVISWNALVSGFAHNGEIDESLRLFKKMQDTGLKPTVSSWNGVVSGCVQNEYYEDALHVFAWMLLSTEDPNAVTFACILPACGAMCHFHLGMGIHAYAFKRGLLGNTFVKGSLIGMYVKCGRRDLAERVFVEMDIKNTTIINEMIMAYVNEDNMLQASKLLNSMLTDGIKPDVITYNTMLGGFARKGRKEEAFSLLTDMVQRGLRPDVVSVNALISGFQQSGLSGEALKLFHLMQSPSQINDFVKGVTEAYRSMYSQISRISIRPNSVTIASAVAACADLRSLSKGKEFHGYILRKELEGNIFVSSALVDMYAKCHDMHTATKVFQSIEDKNAVSWNVLMEGHINNMEGEKALKLLPEMMADGLKPTFITLIILLSACCSVGSLRLGRELHNFILRSNFQPNTALSCALIKMYAKFGRIVEARMVFDCEVQKDIVLWNVMISGHAIYGMAKDAIELFEQLKSFEVEPGHNTFATLLLACIYEGILEEGWKYFVVMETYRISPNLEHYIVMVSMMCSAGMLKAVSSFAK